MRGEKERGRMRGEEEGHKTKREGRRKQERDRVGKERREKERDKIMRG